MAERKLRLRKYGWRPDTPDHRDFKYAVPAHLSAVSLPSVVDLRPNCPACYDQGDLGSCHDSETEVLTDSGWNLFKNLTGTEKLATVDPVSGELIYELPKRLIRFHYEGKIYYGEHRDLNFKVTPDHKMLVRKWNESSRSLNDTYDLVEMKDLGWYVGLLDSVSYHGTHNSSRIVIKGVESRLKNNQKDFEIDMEWWLKFLGIYLAEGTMLKPQYAHRTEVGSNTKLRIKSQYKIQIAASKTREKEFVREVLNKIGVKYLELKDRFTFENQRIFAALDCLGLKGVKAPYKFVPEFVFKLSGDNIKHLLHGHFMGDGCEQNGSISHYTSSKKLADDLQLLAFLSGSWASITKREPRESNLKGRLIKGKHPEYRIGIQNKLGFSIDRSKHVTEEYYSGEVFCAEVPTYHTLVTRRNGKILISGNCTGQSISGLCHYDLIKENKGKSFQPSALFIYYNERVLENSVNEDAGAEIRDGIKTLVKWGICPEKYWPYIINKFKTKPSSQAYKNAQPHRIDKYMRLAQDPSQLKACLAEGFPFVFGISVYSSFESEEVAKTGVVPMPSRDENLLGGHAVCCVGYNDADQRYIVRNSWGTEWGQNGYFTLPYEFVHNANLSDDFWTVRWIPE